MLNAISEQGQFGPKLQVEGVIAHQPFFLSDNYMINDLSCGITMWAESFFVLSQSTRPIDRQTDKRTDRIALAIPCVALHAVARQKLTATSG